MKLELLKDKNQTLSFTPPYTDNQPTIASSATIVVKKPDGTTAVESTAVTAISSTTGELTYSVSSSVLDVLGENWIAEWTYVVSGTSYYETTLFDVVLHKLSILLTDQELYDLQGDLKKKNENFHGTVVSATSSTLVDSNSLKSFNDDYFNGGIVEAMNPSNGTIQTRLVTNFVQSTGTLTVSPNWSTTPDNTYKYVVYRPFRNKIEFAWDELMNDIKAKGYRPALIMNSATLKVVHAYKTMVLICMDFTKDDDQDVWSRLYENYKEAYNSSFGKLKFQYDLDESGAISDNETEKNRTTGRLFLNR